MKKLIIICFCLFQNVALAHQDVRHTITYPDSRVIVRITTGYDYEEISKVTMIGELAGRLLKKTNHQRPILLEFEHAYTTPEASNEYFVSWDQGEYFQITDSISSYYYRNVLDRPGIVIRQTGYSFSFENTMKLLEFAIENTNGIRKHQRKYEYDRFVINSLDTVLLNGVVREELSESLQLFISSNKIQRREFDDFSMTSYYWQSGEYFITYRNDDSTYSEALKLKSIKHFERLFYFTFIFDTDSSFYVVSSNHPYKPAYNLSQKFIITDLNNNHVPYRLSYISGDFVALKIYSKKLVKRSMTTEYEPDDTLVELNLKQPGQEIHEFEVPVEYMRVLVIDVKNSKILQSLNEIFEE